jgi:hypothetical protein
VNGLVSARQGHANFIHGSESRWLFVAYGGHEANKNASILCLDYETGAWHSFYKDSTANQDCYHLVLSGEDDGTVRLHATTEGAAASTCFMFEHPLVSAVSGVSQQFKATGYVDWAEDDNLDPHTDSTVFNARVSADDLDNAATVEAGNGTNTVHIELEYGVDGAAATTVSNIGFFVSDDPVLYFGKTFQNTADQSSNPEAGTPIGVTLKRASYRLVFFRDGTATNTPKLKEFQVEATNELLDLDYWDVVVDLARTAEVQGVDGPEAVITNLKTIRENGPAVEFEHGQDETRYVKMDRRSLSYTLTPIGDGDGQAEQQRSGTAEFRIKEMQRVEA